MRKAVTLSKYQSLLPEIRGTLPPVSISMHFRLDYRDYVEQPTSCPRSRPSSPGISGLKECSARAKRLEQSVDTGSGGSWKQELVFAHY